MVPPFAQGPLISTLGWCGCSLCRHAAITYMGCKDTETEYLSHPFLRRFAVVRYEYDEVVQAIQKRSEQNI